MKKKTHINVGFIAGLVIAIMMLAISVPVPIPVHDDGEWHVIWKGTFADFASATENTTVALGNVSGILEIFFINNTPTPNLTYAQNNSYVMEEWCNASGLGFANETWFSTELQHSVDFDIVVRVQANKTICANSTGLYGVYNANRLRVNITSADLGIDALTGMIGVETVNVSTNPFIWMNYWINWTGTYDPTETGYQLTPDQSADITAIVFEAYY